MSGNTQSPGHSQRQTPAANNDRVLAQYLRRHAEPEARKLIEASPAQRWQQTLVIPAYNESAALLERTLPCARCLLILVINRPDTDDNSQCNDALRTAAHSQAELAHWPEANARLLRRADGNELLLIERPSPLPHKQGVGLARKLGCDIALALYSLGCVESRWIHCSDADAILPEDYFAASAAAGAGSALVYPYRHVRPEVPREREAIDVYESFLHHYVDGLRYAGSPYAFHTLGSCLAVDARAYAQVRGFPRRSGGEDFYLLNKLAKIDTVRTLNSDTIVLSARLSTRVPFGTGPALQKLLETPQPRNHALFYHPQCFEGLRVLLNALRSHGHPPFDIEELRAQLASTPQVNDTMDALGLEDFLVHARRHCADPGAFLQQFHQWFDGFRTRKFIHALDAHWGRVSFDELAGLPADPMAPHARLVAQVAP